MAASAAQAITAWVNKQSGITGKGKPLSRGAYLAGTAVKSPAYGAYALLNREPGTPGGVVAEDSNPSRARITAHVFAGTAESAENAAAALANAWQNLNGLPEPCGTTGVTVMVADNFSEPGYVPMPASGGELHCFTTSADFILLTHD